MTKLPEKHLITMKLKCGCVIATTKNTASVRKGYECGGYVKEFCGEHQTRKDDMVTYREMRMAGVKTGLDFTNNPDNW